MKNAQLGKEAEVVRGKDKIKEMFFRIYGIMCLEGGVFVVGSLAPEGEVRKRH
ncbi:MAG: hypothetical protein HPY58_13460 [Firmicutes bacterium]|nr:hypothetical protein [Bacillota bacterium]NPV30625.1 hypothetical protein [Bacillota bacterium]